ncbi:hypothetical protein N7519_003463 [Penicillium mononematosum]|uniref:uncharacterized protein n=1 Tax=Penicillium mononematosum TaxID=268346 RepID=UPI00254779B5|nr:uncharacterized protein N7519_003463 [Penicillium mononematosum]KAJ6188555.1 hypothetical protein N7519_003463 [Penicillium mononematosum]
MTAARNGHVEILQMFIDKLPSTIKKFAHRSSRLLNVAATHGYGFTPGRSTLDSLQDAVKGGHLPVLEYLLDEGTCKDSQDLVDLLDHATSGCHLEIVKYLVKRGADFICPLSGYPPSIDLIPFSNML